jgi:fibronectin-binding autotransporter adhesin
MLSPINVVGPRCLRVGIVARCVAAAWGGVCVLLAAPNVTTAATYTWSGGTSGGEWNTTSLNWNSGATAWPNFTSPADNATFNTAGAAVTVASQTLYVNTITMGASTTFTGVGSASTLAFSGSGASVTTTANSLTVGLSNLTLDTGEGVTFSGNAATFSLGAGTSITGTGAVQLRATGGGTTFGNSLTLNAGNANFAGGFIATKGAAALRRTATITATVADSLGTGASLATGNGAQLVYAQGAQTAVGGVTAGLTASNFGAIVMSGAFTSASRDRFTLQSEGILNGTTAQLSQVKRVSSYSASPTQAEGVFASGSALVVTTNNANMDTALQGMNLGTATDLYFGLGTTFNNASFAISVGANSPWRGFGTDGQVAGETGSGARTLSAGTVTVNTANGNFNELPFRSFKINYDSQSVFGSPFVLGAATFVKNGTGNVTARVMPYSRLDLQSATTSGFFADFRVDASGWLYSSQSNAVNGKNVSVAASAVGVLPPAINTTVVDTIGTLTFSDGSYIFMPTVTGGTSTLTVDELSRSGQAGLTVTGASLSGAQKVYIPSELQRGKMVVPYIVGNGLSGQFLPGGNTAAASDFLLIDGTGTNLGLIRYGTQSIAYDTAWQQGNVVLASDSGSNVSISGTVSVDSFKVANSITGSGQINLGVLANGTRAAQAGISSLGNAIAIAPTIDLDTAELVVWNDMDVSRTLTFTGAVRTSGGLSKNGRAIAILANAGNDITGSVAVNQGTLRISGGNGLGDSATLNVAEFGTFDLSGASEQIAALTGSGSVAVASTRTLTVSGATSGTFSGVVSGAGGMAKGGAGALTLSGNNTFAGGLQLSGGTLTAGHAGAFGSGTVSVAGNSALDLGAFAVANPITNNGGVLLNAASYAGTQTLAGTSLFTGTVGGTLNVASGGVLKGNGTSFTGPVVIQTGGIHAPGASPGLQTFSSGLTYDAGSVLQWELIGNSNTNPGTTFDQVLVTGGNLSIATSGQLPELNLVFNGTGSVVDWSNSFWNVNRTWIVIDHSGDGSSSGSFLLGGSATTWIDSLGASLATARSGNANFSVGSSGGDIVLSYAIVPEPGAATLACLGIGLALVAACRRKRVP